MNLKNYRKNLFEEICANIVFEHDRETNQFCLINDETPGIFGVGVTKELAITEYLSGLKDMILMNHKFFSLLS